MMMAKFRQQLLRVEAAIDANLKPLGFKRQRSNWRRELPEVLQQFSIVSEKLNGRYRPEWGLNLASKSTDAKPSPSDLQVQWILEPLISPNIVGRGHDDAELAQMLEVKRAFHMAYDVSVGERMRLIDRLLRDFVLPCFDRYQTEISVRKMAGNYRAALRAQYFGGLPRSWLPKRRM
jgi:hypothetical protein